MRRGFAFSNIFVLILASATQLYAADPRVELDVFVSPKAPIETAQNWTKLLQQIPLERFRIVAGSGTEKPNVRKSEAGNVTSFLVTGTIGMDGRLSLPGKTFKLDEKAKLSEWLANLDARDDVIDNAERQAFGLTDQQLVELFERLSPAVDQDSNGMRASDLLSLIESKTELKISIQADVRDRLTELISENLSGLSSGTAAAAAVRPLGLVIVPKRERDHTSLTVTDVRSARESWPVGWPREKRGTELIPKLLDRLNAEIVDTPLSDVISAVQPRLRVPFLFDQNSMARQNIEPAKTKITIAGRRTTYGRVIDICLAKGNLKSEIRVDEAGRPFFWVSPIKE